MGIDRFYPRECEDILHIKNGLVHELVLSSLKREMAEKLLSR